MGRTKFPAISVILFLIFFLGTGTSFSAAADNISFTARKVKFVGIEAGSTKELAESLVTKVPPFWKFWLPHPVVQIKDLDDDILRIRQYYQAQGYYQATAEYEIIPSDPEKSPEKQPETVNKIAESKTAEDVSGKGLLPEYDVVFHVKEGSPVIIRDISTDCDCALENISDERIRQTILLKPGLIFKTSEYDQSKASLKKLLGNRGYPFAKIQGRATVDLNDDSADIVFEIDAGQLYIFGDIHLEGHEEYVQEEVIHRAITFKRGERFSARKIDESRRNLFDLSIFQTAVVKMGDAETEGHTVPIDIQVKPRKQRSVKLGVGYGTDDGLRLQAGWSYRNLTGRADRLTLRARRSDIVENIYAEYLLPYFLSARNNLVSTTGYENEEKDYYTLKQTSTEVNFNRKLGGNWFASLGYNLENNRPEDVSVEDAEGEVDPRDTENYLVSSVKAGIAHTTVDDVLNSRKGTVVSLSFEDASGYLGSEIDYIRPGVDARVFIPMPWEMVFAARIDFRSIQETRDTDYIPISKQFFMGGSKSVRGYGFEKLGVINENDVIEDVSGLSSFISNMELRFPIYKEFGGVVFLDAGALNQNSFSVDFNSLRYTSGLGLRYNTIIGPIQLDFGYQLNPAKRTISDDPSLTSLLDDDRWYLHFNIGQAF